jgi:ATP-dependent Clp protease ATP-binding subunit ClpA
MTPPPNLQDLIDTVRQDTSTDSPLDQLATAAAAVAELEDTSDALLGHFVDRCRRDGRSWSEISAALGVTKQAVHKRFAASVADQIIASIPTPTMERFTTRARVAISSAALAARDAGRSKAGAVHILIGLFAEPEGIAAKVLQQLGVSRDGVRAAVQARLAADEPDSPADGTTAEQAEQAEQAEAGGGVRRVPQFTADGRLALRDALAVALELGHNYIGTEHLLLGILRNPESPATAILLAAGATEADTRARVLELLRGYQPPEVR